MILPIIHSLIIFITGIFNSRKIRKTLVLVILALPYSTGTLPLFYLLGFSSFLIFPFADILRKKELKKIKPKSILAYLGIILIFFISFNPYRKEFSWIILIKDLIPILTILLFRIWNASDFTKLFTKKSLVKIIKAGIKIHLIISFIYVLKPDLFTNFFNDPYYIEQFRPVTTLCYLAPLIILNKKYIRLNQLDIFLLISVVLISGSRMLLLLLFIALLIKSNYKILLLSTILFSIIFPSLIEFFFPRELEKFSVLNLQDDLLNRLVPFLETYTKMTSRELLFGQGIGTGIYIPWFEYRGLNPYNAYLDNLYATLFIKYGFSMIIYIILILLELRKIFSSKDVYNSYIFWMSLLGLTNAIIYTHNFIFSLLFLLIVNSFDKINRFEKFSDSSINL